MGDSKVTRRQAIGLLAGGGLLAVTSKNKGGERGKTPQKAPCSGESTGKQPKG